MARPRITVVGSFMIDLVTRVPHFPRPGESLIVDEMQVHLGGKGYNQAVAAARCGADVAMIGRLGDDAYGARFLAALAAEGVRDGGIVRDAEAETGLALPLIDPTGQNAIIVAPRANLRLAPGDVQARATAIAAAQLVMLQFEVPLTATLAAAQIARTAGATVMLNAAPVVPAGAALDDVLALCDVIVVNEIEAEALSGVVPDSPAACRAAAAAIGRRCSAVVVITLGAAGAVAVAGTTQLQIAGHRLPVVDTTGAGDAFCGAFAVALAEGKPLEAALAWGNAAGGLAVGAAGATGAMPRREATEALVATLQPPVTPL